MLIRGDFLSIFSVALTMIQNSRSWSVISNFATYGTLKRQEVADLLGRCDVFIDLSDYQAFGRTALEAMACGCTSVVPMHGGAEEYVLLTD